MEQPTYEVLPFHGGELFHGSQRSASFKLMPEYVQVCLSDRNGKLEYGEVNQADKARDI